MTEIPSLDTACPTVLYERLIEHVRGCAQCNNPAVIAFGGECATGRELLKAWGDAERKETALADDATPAVPDSTGCA